MRETVGSLRAYFIVFGLYCVWATLSEVGNAPLTPVARVSGILGLAFAVAFVVTGILMKRLLASRPLILMVLVAAHASIFMLGQAVSLLRGEPVRAVLLGVEVGISAYLIYSVKRLTAQPAT
jgi:hypothetical protein